MLSYAQNMEDVVLDRLFPGKTDGFYIDVGGGHAVADNVSYLFYERGWRGLVVEPQAKLAALYAQVRPRDTVIEALLGRSEGTLELFEASTFHGLSTASESHAKAAEEAGVAGRRIVKQVVTLAGLAASHTFTTVDFLKIDVEGHEAEVIAGNDWTRLRPHVVLVEAIEPISMADSSHRFEPALLAAGYQFAWFDNLNRWYVADEVADTYRPRFPVTSPAWDSVRHLGEYGEAQVDKTHPDHALARKLFAGFMARLPHLDDSLLSEIAREHGFAADRGALARIASNFDGGYVQGE